MLNVIKREIEKLPQTMTRQEVLNWYIDNLGGKWGASGEITTGQLIYLIKKSGRQVKGQSKLAIHISPEEERKYKQKSKADLTQKKVHVNIKIPDSEREKVQDMYYRCRMSLAKIAEHYGCCASTIQKKMKEWQLETRARGTETISSMKTQKTLSGDYIWSKKFA